MTMTPAKAGFNDLMYMLERDFNICADKLWEDKDGKVRFVPDADLAEAIYNWLSDFSCENLSRYIGHCNVTPQDLTKVIKSRDFTTFHDMLCATAYQVVMVKLRRHFPASQLTDSTAAAA